MSTHLLNGELWKIFRTLSLSGCVFPVHVTLSLRYAFQSQTKLYLVMDFFNGGELFHYLSSGRFSEVSLPASIYLFLGPSQILRCRDRSGHLPSA